MSEGSFCFWKFEEKMFIPAKMDVKNDSRRIPRRIHTKTLRISISNRAFSMIFHKNRQTALTKFKKAHLKIQNMSTQQQQPPNNFFNKVSTQVSSFFGCEPRPVNVDAPTDCSRDFPANRRNRGHNNGRQVTQAQVEEWACPRCTLLNPTTLPKCGACNYNREQQQRAADPVRRERLVQSNSNSSAARRPTNGSFMLGGSVVGCVLGAVIGLATGNPVGGALEGAMNGAMSGAVIDSVSRNVHPQQQVMQRQQQARASDPMLAMMMEQSMNPAVAQRYARQNVDGMTYEQRLQAFGDGSETQNRGANEQAIASLPTSRVQEQSCTTNSDHSSCPICLDEFKEGDNRKTLPCLHGFHGKCVDKWLRKNASCPICKHSIQE